jgi:hypothetical protein
MLVSDRSRPAQTPLVNHRHRPVAEFSSKVVHVMQAHHEAGRCHSAISKKRRFHPFQEMLIVLVCGPLFSFFPFSIIGMCWHLLAFVGICWHLVAFVFFLSLVPGVGSHFFLSFHSCVFAKQPCDDHAIVQLCNCAIMQSCNRAIVQSCNRAILQLYNHTIL